MTSLARDVLIIGSGAAGLYGAWQAARAGLSVTLISQGALYSGATYWAQGGIAAVTDPLDSIAAHVADTLAAGRGLCHAGRVQALVAGGADCVADLLAHGMPFDRDAAGTLARGLEGGHGTRRILHALGAETGRALSEFLCAQVQAHPAISCLTRRRVHQLVRDDHGQVIGAHVHGPSADDNAVVRADATLLATGGYAGLFARSTNPPGATGAGLVLAADAGARLADLEFVQFHPTAFYGADGHTFLLTEALRGAGAYLIDSRGQRFLADIPGAELAPRDVVASAIHRVCESDNAPYVGLDLRHLDHNALARAFPALIAHVANQGIDIAQEPIPVAPAAHYCIGGVVTDDHGKSDIPGLYAAGEVAATGVHGANRLASNSLLECLVFARRAIATIGSSPTPARRATSATIASVVCDASRRDPVDRRLAQRREILMRDCGLVRDANSLMRAREALHAVSPVASGDQGISEYHAHRDRQSAWLSARIVTAAAARRASVGVHYRADDQTGESAARPPHAHQESARS